MKFIEMVKSIFIKKDKRPGISGIKFYGNDGEEINFSEYKNRMDKIERTISRLENKIIKLESKCKR